MEFLIKTLSLAIPLIIAAKIVKVRVSIVGIIATAAFVFALLNIFSGLSAIIVCVAALVTFVTKNIGEEVKMTLLVLLIAAVIHAAGIFIYVSFVRDLCLNVSFLKEVIPPTDPKTFEDVYKWMFENNGQFATFFNGWLDANSRSNKIVK